MPSMGDMLPGMTKQASDILAALQNEKGDQLQKLAELVVDGILGCRVDQLVDIDLVMGALDAAFCRSTSVQVVERYLKPAAAREHQRARDSQEPVNAFLPEAEARALIDIIRRPFPVNPRIVNDLVEQKAVRSLLASIVQEAIQGFVSRAPIPGLSRAMGLMSNLSRRMDQHLGEFMDKSMTRLTKRLAELALSESGQKLIGEMSAEIAKITFKNPVSFYYDEMAKLPTDELWALLPPILAHNLSRPEIREALAGEVRALLERDGQSTAGEFLEELGIHSQVRSFSVHQAREVVRQIVSQPAFESWLIDLIE